MTGLYNPIQLSKENKDVNCHCSQLVLESDRYPKWWGLGISPDPKISGVYFLDVASSYPTHVTVEKWRFAKGSPSRVNIESGWTYSIVILCDSKRYPLKRISRNLHQHCGSYIIIEKDIHTNFSIPSFGIGFPKIDSKSTTYKPPNQPMVN